MANSGPALTDPNSALSPYQKRLVTAILAHPTLAAAAEALGVSRTTIHAHLHNDAVRTALRSAQVAAFDETLRNLTQLGTQSLSVLGELLHSDSDAVRLAAVRLVLDMALRFRSDIVLEERLTKIETMLGDNYGQAQK